MEVVLNTNRGGSRGITSVVLGLYIPSDADVDSSVADMCVELCELLNPDGFFLYHYRVEKRY